MSRTSLEELFPSELIAAAEGLRITARRVAPGGRPADHHTRAVGSGLEFRDHRSYSAGDDVRRIDWSLFRRTDRLFIRLMDDARDLPMHIVLDLSDSAWVEDPPRADAGRRVAALFAATALNQHDRVQLSVIGADAKASDALEPISGKGALPRVLRWLAEREPAGETDLERSLSTIASRTRRPGLMVLVSDLFDPAGPEALEAGLRKVRDRVAVMQLTRPDDERPTLDGELSLEDCERPTERLEVAVDDQVRRRYAEVYSAWAERTGRVVAQRESPLVRIDVTAPIPAQLATLFEAGTYAA